MHTFLILDREEASTWNMLHDQPIPIPVPVACACPSTTPKVHYLKWRARGMLLAKTKSAAAGAQAVALYHPVITPYIYRYRQVVHPIE